MLSESSNLIAHETEIIRILKILNEATDGFVLIGGYAVNAHGQHRFSVDCELATNRDNVPVIDATLLGEGYELKRSEVRPHRRDDQGIRETDSGRNKIGLTLRRHGGEYDNKRNLDSQI